MKLQKYVSDKEDVNLIYPIGSIHKIFVCIAGQYLLKTRVVIGYEKSRVTNKVIFKIQN